MGEILLCKIFLNAMGSWVRRNFTPAKFFSLGVRWYYTIVQCTFILENCYKVEVVSKDGDEVVVRGGDDRRDVRGTGSLRLSIKEVVTHRAIDHTPPVLLHKDLTVHMHIQKLKCGYWIGVVLVLKWISSKCTACKSPYKNTSFANLIGVQAT